MDNQSAGGFIPYPTNRVAGTISDATHASRAVDRLVEAGFDRDAIDVLHGEQDLHRLDPSGGEHGVFAKLQRSLIRGAVGSEFKRLTHHVEDVQAGRYVVMVLALDRDARDRAADILHANGAEFVGFYGRWAYESLPKDGSAGAPRSSGTYEVTAGEETVRVHLAQDGSAVVLPASPPATSTRMADHLWLVSWQRKDAALVHVIDVITGVAYTSVLRSHDKPLHVKGTVVRVE